MHAEQYRPKTPLEACDTMQKMGLRLPEQCGRRCIWQKPSLWSREALNIWIAAIEAHPDPDTKDTLYHVEQLKFESAMRTWCEEQEGWKHARALFDWLCGRLNNPQDADDPDPEEPEE